MALKNRIIILTPYGAKNNLENFPEFILAKDLAKDHQVDFITSPEKTDKNYQIANLTIYRFVHRMCLSFGLLLHLLKSRNSIKAIFLNHIRSDFNYSVYLLKKIRLLKCPIILIPQGILHDDFLYDDRQNPLNEEPKIHNVNFTFFDYLKSPNRVSWRNYAWHSILKAADQIVCISEYEKSFIEKYFQLKNTKVIYNGIPVSSSQRSPITGIRNILFIGQLKKRKGYDIYLKIAKKLISTGRYFFSMVTVTPKLPEEYRADFEALQASKYFQIHHHLTNEELQKNFLKQDILLIPSRYEGFGLSVVEAMQKALIVLAADVPAINEIIESGKNGFLIKNPEDENNWLEVLSSLEKNHDLEKIQQQAVLRAQDFSEEKMCLEYRSLI